MCEHWGIKDNTYRERMKQGMSLEQALTTSRRKGPQSCTDHLGQKFKSIEEMCKYWNILRGTYESRIHSGMSLEDTLTTPVSAQKIESIDPYGNIFPTLKDMFQAYNVRKSNLSDNLSLIEELHIIRTLTSYIRNYTFDEHLTILHAVNHNKNTRSSVYRPKYFACIFDGYEVMLPYKWIIQYCEQHLPPEKNPMR